MVGIIAWALAIYAGLAGVLFVAQRNLMYFPNDTEPVPTEFGVGEMSVERIETPDGYRLLAWWRAPAAPGKPVILYFPGNAGHLGYRAEKIRPYLDAGYGVLLVSYRYNAGAGGSPSEDGLYADARAAAAFAAAKGVPDRQMVVYGESIGAGPAVKVATERKVGAVVLEAPFTSIAEVAQSHYWYMPAKWLLWDKFDIAAMIGKVEAPLLVVHGERDGIVPTKFGRRLFEMAPEPKEGKFLSAAGHNDLHEFGLARIVIEFLDRKFGGG